jgi:hypothetical protein
MGQKMKWSDIQEKYPNEWVAIAHYEKPGDAPYGEIIGDVVAHASDENDFTCQIKSLPKDLEDIDVRYTGEVLPDNPVGSLLWQM